MKQLAKITQEDLSSDANSGFPLFGDLGQNYLDLQASLLPVLARENNAQSLLRSKQGEK